MESDVENESKIDARKNLIRFILSSFDSEKQKREVIQAFQDSCQGGGRFQFILHFKPL